MTDTGIEPVKTWFAAKHLKPFGQSVIMGATGFEPAIYWSGASRISQAILYSHNGRSKI